MNEYMEYGIHVKEWTKGISELLDQAGLRENLSGSMDEVLALATPLEEGNVREADINSLHHAVESLYREAGELMDGSSHRPKSEKTIAPGKHTLPPLPYRYDALEPVISEKIMQLHHDVHHQSYVDGLNKAELMMKKARETNNYDLLKHWEREAAFHGSGHYLHTIFWEVMTPRGEGKPKGDLLRELERDFGSFDAFKKQFSEAAKKVEGVGWALLVWSPRARRLEILQSERHMILTQWDTIPLLVLDVWEHAYYLQYTTNRNAYVDNWWNIVNWPSVTERFEKARKLVWKAY
ncbi:superoxide dismutase [Peribacillus cavernae]|uniref:superoxide dismutase n=1 Tax=Peribacillus cavernae TaxID=1674310 RepID=A0A433HDW6_9BACI|nr:superoxide dismutase [Peribacillus cavernae]MDQ0219040.1 Fe-Mn family superoxide dismutase [Peribacillus cavernae]RUQ26495.1 superoxide dismutase [Peribacillus cavernae]